MDAEKDHQGEFAVLRVIAGGARPAAAADLERECPELSAAKFQRFLKAANETDPDSTGRAHRRARLTRATLTLVLIALAGLTVFLAGGWKEEGAARAAELARVQREICRSSLRFAHRTPDELERLCPPSR